MTNMLTEGFNDPLIFLLYEREKEREREGEGEGESYRHHKLFWRFLWLFPWKFREGMVQYDYIMIR